MPQPAYFRTVISRTISRHGYDSEPLADAIIADLDLAEDLMRALAGSEPDPPRPKVILPVAIPSTKSVDLSKGLLINVEQSASIIDEEAPPTAVVRNPDGAVIPETDEEIEQKKSVLHSWILANLPPSMTIELPRIGQLILIRYLKLSPAPMNFIRVLYAQYAEQEDGPQVSLSTGDQHLTKDVIKAEILRQAEMRYRKERPKIEARTPPPPPMPDIEKMFTRTPENSTDETTSAEDIAAWNQHTGRKI